MQRDVLLLTEMIDAAEQAHQLVGGMSVGQLEDDRQRRDALLWNFTVLGQAVGIVRRHQAAVPGHSLAAARPAEEPDSPRLLVHRLEVLHTTALTQFPAFTADLHKVFTADLHKVLAALSDDD